MKYPTWNEFLGKYPDNPQDAFEALCRLLFRAKYGRGDSLPYFYNNAGNETSPITVGKEEIGFQSKFFTGFTIDDSQAGQLKHSIETAHKHYPTQNKIIIYTNLVFGNPPEGKSATSRQKDVEDTAKKNSLEIEWMFGNNILDAVSKNPLTYTLFFDLDSNLHHIATSVLKLNKLNFSHINTALQYEGKDIEIDRTKEVAALKELIVQHKNVLLLGESGSGKSAIVKKHWQACSNTDGIAYYFIRGEQFDARSVNELFSMDEDYTYVGFRDFYQGYTTKILVIDSAEKLTEIENKTILQIVIEGLAECGWQFVFTCKSNSVDEIRVLMREMLVGVEVVNVERISEESLQEIGKKIEIQLPDNAKLLRQLQIPFYFARYCELGNINVSTPEVFRENVWRQKVWGTTKGGSQQKREKCLLSVVSEQQSKRAYYVLPVGVDHDMAYALVKEDVLIQHPHKGYAVKHDIYVDWSLDYILDNDFGLSNDYLSILAAPPRSISYLNAFTRWFGNIIDTTDERVKAITRAYVDGKVHRKWEYNILTCIGKSELFVTSFFRDNDKALKFDDYALFDQFVEVLSVSCRKVRQYFEYKGEKIPLYQPVGKGWDEAVLFITKNQNDYYMNHLGSVQKLLSGYSNMGKNGVAMNEASALTLPIFITMAEARKKKESLFREDNLKPWCNLVCTYAYGIRKELRDIFHEVIANKWTSHGDPYAELITYILKDENHLGKSMLYISCLDEVIEMMELFWKEPSKNKENRHDSYFRARGGEHLFGLNEEYGMDMAYFPSSPFQTPIKTMLETEQLLNPQETKVLDFVIRFVDDCISVYERRSKHEKAFRVAVQLPDGNNKEVIASQALWNIYRCTSSAIIPHVIESIHMALEAYLLALASDKEQKPDWERIRKLLWRIITNSHSASLYAIVASVTTAFPDELYDIFLFLCQDIRFLVMDLHRYTMEITANHRSIAFHRHVNWWKEREQSNNMPHRQQHLETMLLYCQLNYDKSEEELAKTRLQEAYRVVDSLKVQAAKYERDDVTIGILFQRLDYRSHEKREVTLKNGVVAVELKPHLNEKQKAVGDEAEKTVKRFGAMGLRVWADKSYRGTENELKGNAFVANPRLALDVIRNIEKQQENDVEDVYVMPGDEYVPYMTSAVLLMRHSDILSDPEKTECWERVMRALNSPESMASNTLSEFNICMAAIPVMMDMYSEKRHEFVPIISSYIQEPYEYIHERICDMMSKVIVDSKLWAKYPDVLNDVLKAVQTALTDGDYENMTEEQADAVLCLLTYNPPVELRHIGKTCVDKMSSRWHVASRYNYDEQKHFYAENIAKYILYAPQQEVSQLIGPFVSHLDMGATEEPLITQILINAAQYSKYENFWMVWKSIYQPVIQGAGPYYHDGVLNEYLLNPLFFQQDYDDWFILEEKDLAFFTRVVNDIGGHPAVIYAFSRVFATIGKRFASNAIGIFYIIAQYGLSLKESKNVVIFYMDKIVQKVMAENAHELQSNMQFKVQYTKVLEFLRENGSLKANEILNLL